MQLQYSLAGSQGLTWFDATQPEEKLLSAAVAHDRKVSTPEEARAALERGDELQCGEEWYQKVRCAEAAARKRQQLEERAAAWRPRVVRCDCGHECEAGLVMSASMGTSCPDCYDRMSE